MRILSTLLLCAGLLLWGNSGFSQKKASPIRNIDFNNFRYVGSIGHFHTEWYPRNPFTVRKGKFGNWRDGMTLRKIVYGDVTGDGRKKRSLPLTLTLTVTLASIRSISTR